jgi:hypothetical protein
MPVLTHLLGMPWQLRPGPQLPQSSVPPQPSLCPPHVAPIAAHVVLVQVVTHWPVMPFAPQVWLLAQVPQSMVP